MSGCNLFIIYISMVLPVFSLQCHLLFVCANVMQQLKYYEIHKIILFNHLRIYKYYLSVPQVPSKVLFKINQKVIREKEENNNPKMKNETNF